MKVMNIENYYFVIFFFPLTSYCVQNKLHLLEMSMIAEYNHPFLFIYSTFKHPEKTSVNI